MPSERILTGAQALREGLDQAMAADPRVVVIGEGVPDPKGIFGTTLGLRDTYGPDRVFDMPVSESAVTGVCIGAALRGLRPVMTHQRVDFSLYALDQIINNAAKWHFMFGGQSSVPLVIRAVIGRGWGQGAQHSQSLHSLFAHIPGLKVVMPATPYDAKGLLLASIADNNPVIFLEHRWIHGLTGHVPEEPYLVPLGQAHVVNAGDAVTVVASSHMTIEALRAAHVVQQVLGVNLEVLDVRTIKPLDRSTIIASVRKTRRLLVVDGGWLTAGFAAEVIASVVEAPHVSLTSAPQRLTVADVSSPSAPGLTKTYYPTYQTIVTAVGDMLGGDQTELTQYLEREVATTKVSHDVPDPTFSGPF